MSSEVRWVAPRFLSGWVWVRGESPRFTHNDALMLSRQLLSSNLMLHEGGASLGLVISDATVALHGGLVGYVSAENVGSLLFFWVRLPQVLQLSNGVALGPDGKPMQLPGDCEHPVVFIVEDERSSQIHVKRNVERFCHSHVRVMVTNTAEAAIDTMRREAEIDKSNSPGLANWLVIMDHGLAGRMNGAQAALTLLRDRSTRKCTIIGHSGGQGDEFDGVGVAGKLHKPSSKPDVHDLLVKYHLGENRKLKL